MSKNIQTQQQQQQQQQQHPQPQKTCSVEKDLEKFIKLFALKTTQVVVQSRLGEKMQTQWNPSDGNDWFNIVVEDHPDVNAEAKRVLALSSADTILQRLPMCIEISLRTAEGDQMVLEVWSLDLQRRHNGKDEVAQAQVPLANGNASNDSGVSSTINGQSEQQCLKATHAIYNRMGILLKSLISLTRAVPAYKLSRVQCPDSYSIYYRIYVAAPQTTHLGEGHKSVRIGQLNTIVGNLVLSVAYRTKMTITPTSMAPQAMGVVNGHSDQMMMDSNHFQPNMGGGGMLRKLHPKAGGLGCFAKGLLGGAGVEKKVIDLEKPMRPGAFTEIGKLRQYTEEDFVLPEVPPFEWILGRPRRGSLGSDGGSASTSEEESYGFSNGYGKSVSPSSTAAVGPFDCGRSGGGLKAMLGKSPTESTKSAQSPPRTLFVPVTSNGIRSNASNCTHSKAATSIVTPSSPTSLMSDEPASPTSRALQDEDSLLKELYFPFASNTSHVNDLAKFYRDCYYAPPLRGLNPTEQPVEDDRKDEEPSDSSEDATTSAFARHPQGKQQNINEVMGQHPAATEVAVAAGGCGTQSSRSEVRGQSAGANYSTDDLTRQLQLFETSLEDYDRLVSQLSTLTASSASTGSRSSGGGALQLSN